MTNKLYIVEEFFNEYDQHGGIALAVFNYKPEEKDLKLIPDCTHTYFGRKDDEFCWVEWDYIPYIQHAD